jgi:hypothetical protein
LAPVSFIYLLTSIDWCEICSGICLFLSNCHSVTYISFG